MSEAWRDWDVIDRGSMYRFIRIVTPTSFSREGPLQERRSMGSLNFRRARRSAKWGSQANCRGKQAPPPPAFAGRQELCQVQGSAPVPASAYLPVLAEIPVAGS